MNSTNKMFQLLEIRFEPEFKPIINRVNQEYPHPSFTTTQVKHENNHFDSGHLPPLSSDKFPSPRNSGIWIIIQDTNTQKHVHF